MAGSSTSADGSRSASDPSAAVVQRSRCAESPLSPQNAMRFPPGDQLGSTAAALGLTGTEQSLLPTLGTGQGLWRIKHRSFVVQHQLHPAELQLFDTTGRMSGRTS